MGANAITAPMCLLGTASTKRFRGYSSPLQEERTSGLAAMSILWTNPQRSLRELLNGRRINLAS